MKRTAHRLDVLRPAAGYDCTMAGASSTAHSILVVTDGVLFTEPGPFDPDAIGNDLPVFVVAKAGGRFHIRPESEGKAWLMFGGNFAYSGDSRAPSHPIHIHDRNESRPRPETPAQIAERNRRAMFGANDEAFPSADEWSRIVD